MEQRIDRRSFLQAAGAGAAGAALLGGVRPSTAFARDVPNVLVLVVDSLRADYLGAYGNSWIKTPNMDALARESLRFSRAFPEAMPTVPARRSLMMGRRVYPWHDWSPTRNLPGSPGWTGLGADTTTWIRTMRTHGYWTGYVTDNPFLVGAPEWSGFRSTVDRFLGLKGQGGALRPATSVAERDVLRWLPRGMRSERYLTGMRQHLANVGGARDERDSCAARVYGSAIKELTGALRNRPFAMVVDCFDPHEPWTPPDRYLNLYGDAEYEGAWPGNVRYRHADYMAQAAIKRLPAVYGASVTMVDTWLGRFLDSFYDAGLADETIVVLLSDHGIVLGERGWTGKPALELHPELTHVPFLLRHPGQLGAGQETPYFVSPHDVGPTLLSMTDTPRPHVMNGIDVSPLLEGRQPRHARRFAYGGYANHWYYRDDRWAFIADGNNSGRQLFDLRKDPGERTSIAKENPEKLRTIYRRVLSAANVDRLPYFGGD